MPKALEIFEFFAYQHGNIMSIDLPSLDPMPAKFENFVGLISATSSMTLARLKLLSQMFEGVSVLKLKHKPLLVRLF